MAIDCPAEYKTLIMRKSVLATLYFIFFGAAVLLVIYRMYLRNNSRTGQAETVQWIALALLIAALVCRLLPRVAPGWVKDDDATKN